MRIVLSAGLSACCWLSLAAAPALAGKGDRAPDYAAVSAAVAQILQSRNACRCRSNASGQRLTAHYVRDKGTIYWVGTGRMTPFIQRLADAADDGLNPG